MGDIRLRMYAPADLPAVDSWWRARHGIPFPANQAPPLGIMAEIDSQPVGCLFAYEPIGVPVSFLEFGVTPPHTPFQTARMIFARLFTGITTFLRKDGYGLLRCFAETPAMARALRMNGFEGNGGNLYLIL